MKFDTLLAQFLYQHRKLALPGLGTFTLDGNAPLADENGKPEAPPEGISFSTKAPALPDETLIDFIRSHTGKMKPLAQADLDSYLTLAQQIINIGKPLYLEGIGTIHKIKTDFEFIPGSATSVRLEPLSDKQAEGKKRAAMEEEEARSRNGSGSTKKLVLLLGIAATLALIAIGGYYLYTKNAASGPETETSIATLIQPDTTSLINNVPDSLTGLQPNANNTQITDSTSLTASVPPLSTSGKYKFVIETTANKARALSRYSQLKKNGADINMETRDSVTFKLFFVLPATASDTTRLKDSLNSYFNYNYETKRLTRFTTIEN